MWFTITSCLFLLYCTNVQAEEDTGRKGLRFTIHGQMRESDGRVEIPVLFILIITHSIYYGVL